MPVEHINGRLHWSDPSNNVWIKQLSPVSYLVSHRHTGSCFPRLFPADRCPDHIYCGSLQSAIKQAARMVHAYNTRS